MGGRIGHANPKSRERWPLTFCPSTFPAAWLWCGRTLLGLLAFLLAVLRPIFAVSQKPPLPHHGRKRAVFVFTAFLLLTAGNARAQGSVPCSGGGDPPVPVEVAVTAVPIVVTSTTDDYFVLYVRHDVDGTEVELPVAVTLGGAGTTTLAENVAALPAERYRVEKYLVADPADVDGDCIDDLTELANLGSQNPVNPAASIDSSDGAVAILDQDTFGTLAADSLRVASLKIGGVNVVKFVLYDLDTDHPRVYFMNTWKYVAHAIFLNALDLDRDGIEGQIFYDPERVAPDGDLGVYYYSYDYVYVRFWRAPFSVAAGIHTVLVASLPLLDDNLALHIPNDKIPFLRSKLPLYRASRIPLLFDEDIYGDTAFLALNPAVGYGRLRVTEPDERPHPRDIVLYEALPNTLPRVAGIITTVPQTPLTHVNLRAVQDGLPNAYIRDARDDPDLTALLDSYVRYEVTEDGYTLREATLAEVDAHYAASRPAQTQTPQRDLSVTEITPLSEIGFEDWKAFGVKAANVAVLGTLGFPTGTVPAGFAIPFYFYDRYMQETALGQETVLGKGSAPAEEKLTLAAETKLAAAVEAMLAHSVFQTDFAVQDEMLDDLRDAIKDAETPQWIIDALTAMHATYPEGQSLRYRSSTNNEDLPGFNGAGLYDSKTQHADETEEDGIAKSLKQVYASLWTFRAFTEREFHRIDHMEAAMGVLVHPNYQDELVNGVAVSFDPLSGKDALYYVNSQAGEDLVTNPEAHSVPEELLLSPFGGYWVLATSNQVEQPGQLLMTDGQLRQLRRHLTTIHDHFKPLYNPASDEPFAMEIEFKITADNILAIKQARPWVFDATTETVTPPPPPPPPDPPPRQPPGGGGGGGGGGAPRTSAPGSPRNLTVVGGNGEVVLTWDAPTSDGGAAITDYEYRIDRRNPWISIGSTQTTYTLTGLVNGTAYVFEVRAVNRIGKSFASRRAEAAPEAPPVFTLDFAHFANGDGIASDLVLVNLSTQPARPAIYFYDTEGAPIAAESVVDVTGDLEIAEDGGLTVQTEMDPLGVLTISTHGQGALVSGSVKAVSEGRPIGGGVRYNLPDIGVAGVGASPPVRDALFPARQQAGGIRTAAALHNLGEEPMEVSCRLMSGGAVLEEVEIPLEANGQTSWFIDQAFPVSADTSGFLGSVHCAAPGRRQFTGLAVEIDAANRIFTTLPMFPVDRGGGGSAASLDFAHFANGDGTTSDLVFVNRKTEPSGPAPTPFHVAIPPIRPAIYFYDTEGNPIAAESLVDITGDLTVQEDGALTVLTEMEPLGVLTVSTHGRGSLVSGSVKVISEGPIGGMLRFDLPAIGEAVVGAQLTRQRRPLSRAPPGGRNQHGSGDPQPGIESGVGALRLDARGRAARRCEFPSGGQRADLLAHRPGVPRRRYVGLRGVGALRCTGDVQRRGPGNGPRHPRLHDLAGGAGGREGVSGIVARCPCLVWVTWDGWSIAGRWKTE